jgi:hypothetical protein
MPAPHAEQPDAPAVDEYMPALQLVQALAPASE